LGWNDNDRDGSDRLAVQHRTGVAGIASMTYDPRQNTEHVLTSIS
jgi:hypothetical protein